MVVVGEKDMAARVVSPRTREGKQLPATPLDEFAVRLREEAKTPGHRRPLRHYNDSDRLY